MLTLFRPLRFYLTQGRGGSTGYDNAVALPARADSEELMKENVKQTKALKGSAVFSVAKIDAITGEVGGKAGAVAVRGRSGVCMWAVCTD